MHLKDGLIVDSCVFRAFVNTPEVVFRHSVGKRIYHIDEVKHELFKYYFRLWKDAESANKKTMEILLTDFNSKLLVPNSLTYAVFDELWQNLRDAGMSEEKLFDEEPDILVAAYGISYRMKVMSTDNLFREMEALFPDYLTLHTLPGWGKSLHLNRLNELKTNLRRHGKEPPLRLSSAPWPV